MNKELHRSIGFMALGAQVTAVILFLVGKIEIEKQYLLGAVGWAIAAFYNVSILARRGY